MIQERRFAAVGGRGAAASRYCLCTQYVRDNVNAALRRSDVAVRVWLGLCGSPAQSSLTRVGEWGQDRGRDGMGAGTGTKTGKRAKTGTWSETGTGDRTGDGRWDRGRGIGQGTGDRDRDRRRRRRVTGTCPGGPDCSCCLCRSAHPPAAERDGDRWLRETDRDRLAAVEDTARTPDPLAVSARWNTRVCRIADRLIADVSLRPAVTGDRSM